MQASDASKSNKYISKQVQLYAGSTPEMLSLERIGLNPFIHQRCNRSTAQCEQ